MAHQPQLMKRESKKKRRGRATNNTKRKSLGDKIKDHFDRYVDKIKDF
jgi:hypothetical protein